MNRQRRRPDAERDRAKTRYRDADFDVAEALFSERGFSSVSLREIARQAGVVVSNVTYHHGGKIGILAAIYERHTRPMNARRLELMGEALRIADRSDRLTAILRAYLLPAFSSSSDLSGGGTRFTRMRAILSAEGDPEHESSPRHSTQRANPSTPSPAACRARRIARRAHRWAQATR